MSLLSEIKINDAGWLSAPFISYHIASGKDLFLDTGGCNSLRELFLTTIFTVISVQRFECVDS